MGRWLQVARLLLYLAMLIGGLFPISPSTAEGSRAFLLRLDGLIDPNHAKYLQRGLSQAEKAGAQLVIVQVDTPGGLVSSMRDMVRNILASPVPVITYVGPAGAQAGSAGTFVTAAGHLAAMAPGTNIGAASPVAGGGQELPETLKSKATNDAAALIRSIAEERGRNVEKLEETVRQASSFTAKEALELNIINFIANDLDDLIAKLDGRTVRMESGDVTLDTDGIRCAKPRQECTAVRLSFVERFLSVIADPDISAILLTIGGLGILAEFLVPGHILPGVLGAIALVLAFVALGNLPVNWGGVGLILFAFVLFFLEVQVAGWGILGIGAVISFVLGVIFLFAPWAADPPSISAPRLHVSPWLSGGLAGGLALAVVGFSFLLWRGRKPAPRMSDRQRLIGTTGRVTLRLDPVGSVHLGDEEWSAEEVNSLRVESGERVEVVEVEGLVLKVRKVPKLLPSPREGSAGLDGKQAEG